MKKLLVEFIGTFFLVFIIGCAVTSGTLIPGLVIGSALMVMVYAGGHISGAHFNPAVSLAVFIRGRMGMGEMIQYWIVQILGGLVGATVSHMITGNDGSVAHMPGVGVSISTAVLAELLGTFALAYVVLNVATAKGTAGNSFYGLAIGFTIFIMAASLGGVSGGAFNPAVGMGRNIADSIVGTGTTIGYIWIYIIGPFTGAALAAFAFNFINGKEE